MANRQITITEANNGGFVVYIHGSYSVHGAYANAHDLTNALHEWANPKQDPNVKPHKSNRLDGNTLGQGIGVMGGIGGGNAIAAPAFVEM